MAKRPGNPRSATGRAVAVAGLAPAAGPAAAAGRAARPRPGRTATTARSVNTTTSVTTRPEIQRARTGGASRRPKITSAMAAAPMTAYGTSHGRSRPAAPAAPAGLTPSQRSRPAPQSTPSRTTVITASGARTPRTVSGSARRRPAAGSRRWLRSLSGWSAQ